ncbi:unnamed protein product [Clavelina lepadiformis]|uniref:Geminin n=1 Tax=Clavelina lepadiformis TaxID=159417 RepID=A0ABP0GJC7_CLALP
MSNGVLRTLNSQWKENGGRSPSHKRQHEDEEVSTPSSSSLKHRAPSNRAPLASKENILAKKPSSHRSAKNFFSSNNNKAKTKNQTLMIYDETAKALKKSKTISTQTETFDERKELMCSETPSEEYWELLAEERRKALQEALEENEQIADDLERKDELIDDLKNEIERLEESSSHAQYLASVIEELTQGLNKEENEPTVEGMSAKYDVNLSDNDATKDKSLNTTDGNDQFDGNRCELSDGSCSHDSDKENKPVFIPYSSDSDTLDYNTC